MKSGSNWGVSGLSFEEMNEENVREQSKSARTNIVEYIPHIYDEEELDKFQLVGNSDRFSKGKRMVTGERLCRERPLASRSVGRASPIGAGGGEFD